MKTYPLTHPQMRIWNMEIMYPNSSVSNTVMKYKFKEPLKTDFLEQALNAVVKANDGMRLRMIQQNTQVCQYVSDYHPFSLTICNFESAVELQEWVAAQAATPMNTMNSDLFAFTYLSADGMNYLLIKQHHLITDAWSVTLLFNQTMKHYSDLVNGHLVIKEDGSAYLTYLETEEAYKASKRFEKNRNFWLENFAELPEICSVKEASMEVRQAQACNREFVLSKEWTETVLEFCENHQISLFRLLLGILYIYLYRITSIERITIGMPLHNRTNATEKQTLGTFISTVPLAVNMHKDMDLLGVLRNISEEQTKVIKNQRFPFDLLIQELRSKHSSLMDYDLFRVMLSYQNAKYESELLEDCDWVFNGTEIYDLSIHVSDRAESGSLKFEIHYSAHLFQPEDIDQLIERFVRLLQESVLSPNTAIESLKMLSDVEENKLLSLNEGTLYTFESDNTIHGYLETQMRKHSSKIAVRTTADSLTYKELNRKANQIARRLRDQGITANHIVGLLVSRSVNMPAAVLGILQSGGAYLPIDPDYPADRIAYMLSDSGARIILTEKKFANAHHFPGKILILEDILEETEIYDDLVLDGHEKDLAYVIYTSGSTGKPKGVMIEHHAVLNFFTGMTQRIPFAESKKILGLTTLSFDIFVLEMLLPLMVGMEIVIADETQQLDPWQLSALITQHNIEMIQITPSRLQLLLSRSDTRTCLQHVSEIMIGGEAMPKHLLESLRKLTNARIYNMYGPTETTVWSTVEDVTYADQVTIGRPIVNTQIYIVNDHNQLQPKEVSGELCIAGEGLARGYMNKPELTSASFVPNPFYLRYKGTSTRMYRTGDIARWKSDGSIEYLGRKNNQIKLRGYRIELGEIEEVFLTFPQITGCTVLIQKLASGEQVLIAYYKADTEISKAQLKRHLIQTLPEYMIPVGWMQLTEFPMTPNGKINRKAFPLPDLSQPTEDLLENEPHNELEEAIIAVWRNVLSIEHVGLYNSFFELGGSSLLLVTMQEQLVKLYPSTLSVADVFANPTPFKLARFIAAKDQHKSVSMDPLLLPVQYLAQSSTLTDEAVNFYCDLSEFVEALTLTVEAEKIEYVDILLSMFVYQLAYLTQQEELSVATLLEEDEIISVLETNLVDISEFSEILQLIHNKRVDRSRFRTDPLVVRHRSNDGEDRGIYPLFISGNRESESHSRNYDLIFHLRSCDATEIKMEVIYNPLRIAKSTVEHLLDCYIAALGEIAELYSPQESLSGKRLTD